MHCIDTCLQSVAKHGQVVAKCLHACFHSTVPVNNRATRQLCNMRWCMWYSAGVQLEVHQPTVQLMKEHYGKTGKEVNEARLRMATLPQGAEVRVKLFAFTHASSLCSKWCVACSSTCIEHMLTCSSAVSTTCVVCKPCDISKTCVDSDGLLQHSLYRESHYVCDPALA